MNFIKKIILLITLTTSSLNYISAQSPALQDSLNILTKQGIQLDDKDWEWLAIEKNRVFIFSALDEKINPDDLAPIQIMIKLSSNQLFNLTDEEIETNDALLTKIIHGTFDQFGKEEYKMMSATTWYGIFKTQAEASAKKNK